MLTFALGFALGNFAPVGFATYALASAPGQPYMHVVAIFESPIGSGRYEKVQVSDHEVYACDTVRTIPHSNGAGRDTLLKLDLNKPLRFPDSVLSTCKRVAFSIPPIYIVLFQSGRSFTVLPETITEPEQELVFEGDGVLKTECWDSRSAYWFGLLTEAEAAKASDWVFKFRWDGKKNIREIGSGKHIYRASSA